MDDASEKLSDAAHKLDAVGGTITSIATTAPITGGPITSTGTIGISVFAGTTPGAVPTGPNDATKFLNGAGAFTTPVGGVTSVGATAPITSTGGSTPNIAINAATGSLPGSMSAADKAKLDAATAAATASTLMLRDGSSQVAATTFTGALAGNATTASDGLTSASGTAPLTLSLSAKALTGSVAAATGSVPGSMSAADKTKLDAATAAATASTLMLRDGSSQVAATTFTGALAGNSTTTTTATGTNALYSATTTVNVSSATAPTNTQVLTATSSTTATWQTPAAAGGLTRIAQVVTASSQSTIHFATIPGTYTGLVITFWGRDTNTAASAIVQSLKFNSDATAANYDTTQFAGTSSGTVTSTTSGAFAFGISAVGSNANAIGQATVEITGYASTAFQKTFAGRYDVRYGAGPTRDIIITSGLWKSTAAITDIVITTAGTAYVDGSICTLYGLS